MIFKDFSFILKIKKPTKTPKALAIISIYSKFLKPEVYCKNSISTPSDIRPVNSKTLLNVRLAVNTKKDKAKYAAKWIILSFSTSKLAQDFQTMKG